MNVSRRDFLKGTIAGAAALTLTGLGINGSTEAPKAEAAGLNTKDPGEKPGFFTDPYQHSVSDAAQVVTAEVVVVGAGNAGCAAAASLADHNVQTIVIEAAASIHGQGGGVGMVNTKWVKQLVDEGKMEQMTDVTLHQNLWVQRCGSRANEKLISMWFNNAPEAGNWLIDKCAEYNIVPHSFRAHAPHAYMPESYDYHMFGHADASNPYPFDDKCGYFNATNVCYTDAKDPEKHEKPTTFFFNTYAHDLLVEDGRVTGVFAQRDGQIWLFRATKGVILATGSIQCDPEMTAYYCDDYINRVQRDEHGRKQFSRGDGQKMGLWVGAKMQDGGAFPLMLHPQACSMFHGCFPFVNKEGERFMNEGTWVQGKSMNIMNQTDAIAYSIFDKNWGEYNAKSLESGVGGGMFWDSMGARMGDPFTADDLKATVEGDITAGNTVVADTLEELADLIGVDKDAFLATMARYNELVKSGEDTDFHKPADFLYPVEEGPFYAAKVGVALLAVVGGLSVNTSLQVLNTEKKPIAGLYATGNASGDLYAIDYPINCAGNSNGRCFIWGYLLGGIMENAEAVEGELTSYDELVKLNAETEAEAFVDETVYKDGEYEGIGTGRNGDIKVKVTVSGGKVANVEILENVETENIGVPAFDTLIQQAVAANGATIDGATGASMTSAGFKDAVAAALELAK